MTVPAPQESGPLGSGETVASYHDYLHAQAAVDHLSDREFPVEHTAIVGVGIRLVEQVTGRVTNLRATGGGAAAGAWFGLLIGLFLALFTAGVGSWAVLVLGGLVWGAIAGAIFGLVGHALQGGRRDFSSLRGLRADRYDIVVKPEYAEQARRLLDSAPQEP
ncbi:general stress protein [Marinactinospora thermotolerans]|uniref:General stress protein 17M-like domain-containing protein n=1 Tax=Marinactinospora thermotolerans DSM 45154 TaxID=1122192 RepID=A0A1T4K5G3_9ACTN|nr:general stress protein [Marinactinospora thermotolerans]SJZ37642.1 hypothetical protein SAMN02745673_00175 [Marinactinospora thermotolerans DSM 45154]